MDNLFGLGILLEYQDRASSGLLNTQKVFSQTEQAAQSMVDNVDRQVQRFNQIMMSGYSFNQVGDSFYAVGTKLLGLIKRLGTEITNVGSDFENSRMTLTALYKDAEIAQRKMMWAMTYAAKTPFEISDVKETLIGLKAIGIEADQMITSVTGHTQELMSYIGDLAALRPDVGMGRLAYALRNAIGGNIRSLQMALDIDVERVLGRKFGASGNYAQDIADLVANMGAEGLMEQLSGTWGQMLSNLQDQFTRFWLAISDAGAFEAIKSTLRSIADTISQIDDLQMAEIGQSIASAFNAIWKPIDYVVQRLIRLVDVAKRIIVEYPKVGKVILGVSLVAGSLFAGAGILLKFAGNALLAVSALGSFLILLKNSGFTLKTFTTALRQAMISFLPYIAIFGSLYLAWKRDLFNIRTTTTIFFDNMRRSVNEARRILGLNTEEMLREMNKLNLSDNFFDGITRSIVKLAVLWQGITDAWGDNTLTEDNFIKLKELGLLPTIEAMLDFKQHMTEFARGFRQGIESILSPVVTMFQRIKDIIAGTKGDITPVLEGVTGVVEASNKLSAEQWEKIGEVVGKIAVIVPALSLITKLMPLFGVVAGGFKTLISLGSILWSGLTIIFNLLSAVFISLAAVLGLPVWAVVAIVAAIGVVVAVIIKYRDQIAQFFVNLWNSIANSRIVQVIKVVFGSIWQVVVKIATAIWTVLSSIFNYIGARLQIVFDVIKGVCKVTFDIVKGVVIAIYTVVKWIVDIVVSIVRAAVNIIISIVSFLVDGIRLIIYGIVGIFKVVFNFVYDNIVAPVVEKISTIFNTLAETIRTIWEPIRDFFSNLWGAIKNKAIEAFQAIVDFVQPIIDAITGFFNSIGEGARNIASGFKNFVSNVGDRVLGLNTGGYVKETGLAVLHPNEVVVNDETTQKLRRFLDGETNNGTAINNSRSNAVYDYSVTFEQGSIVIEYKGGNDEDNAKQFVDRIMKEIERRQQLKQIRHYRPAYVTEF